MFLNQSCNAFMLYHRCFKHSVFFLRSSSFLSIMRHKPALLKKTEFKLIYEFPLIRLPAALLKSGSSIILLSLASSPFIYSYCGSIMPCIILLGGACIHLILGKGFSLIFVNVVGKIYVNKEGEIKEVMISYLDKFGRRTDRIHNAHELINCEYFTKFTELVGFIHINVKNTDLHYMVNIKNYKVLHPSIWENLFGKISSTELKEKFSNKKDLK